jgi:hypothetical protein
MRKFPAIFATFIIVLSSCLACKTAFAATTNVTAGSNGPNCGDGGYFTPSSVTINDGDTITFSVPSNDPYLGGVQVNGLPQGALVISRGGSATTQALHASVSIQGTWPGSPGCIKGSGTITVKAVASPTPSPLPAPSPPSAPSSSSAKSSAKTSPAPAPPAAPRDAAPSAPTLVKVTVGGSEIDASSAISLKPSDSLVLSGKTLPNATVNLTIHSAPKTVTTKADAEGSWTYTISGLDSGDHTVNATVTDPTNNQTSASVALLSFLVTDAAKSLVAASAVSPGSNSSKVPLLAAMFVLVIIFVSGFWLWNNHKSKKTVPPPSTMPTQPGPPNTTD